MKRDNSLREQRDRELYETYVKGLRTITFENTEQAIEWARNQSAPRFFISPKALVNYIGAIRKGTTPSNMYSWNKKKIEVLYQMYLDYMRDNPDCTLSTELICEELVEQPAPCFFIGKECALKSIRRERFKHRVIRR